MMHGMRSTEHNNRMANCLKEEKGNIEGEPMSMRDVLDLTEVNKLTDTKTERL